MLKPRTVAQLGDAPPRPHLIRNVIRDQGSILVYSRTGYGKTRFTWQLACGWARGEPVFGFVPRRPLRVCYIELDLFREEFEETIREMRQNGVEPPADGLAWFGRDSDELWEVNRIDFFDAIKSFNQSNSTDLTIYDAIPDIHSIDQNDATAASITLRSLHRLANSRAYLGVMVQRKEQGMEKVAKADMTDDQEDADDMLGSQAWGRQASSIWKLTKTPSLVWVKSRLCKRPANISLQMGDGGVFLDRYSKLDAVICREAAVSFTTPEDLARRVLVQTQDYGRTAVLERIAFLENSGAIVRNRNHTSGGSATRVCK